MQPLEKVRKMCQPGRHPGRSTDGSRRGYYRPDVIKVSTAPELILVTDEDGDLTGAYIDYIKQEQEQENTP